jgi:uncharacterized membrane protein
LQVLGVLLIGYAAQRPVRRGMLKAGAARRRIRLETSIDINRPVAEVFEFCKDFENFPRVIGSLHSVIDYQDGRSHWEAYSSSGKLVSWDALVTKYMPNSVIAWETSRASDVDCRGTIRFTSLPGGATRLSINIRYAPHHTDMGDALHALATQSRQAQLSDELAHVAFYVESLPPRILRPSVESETASPDLQSADRA